MEILLDFWWEINLSIFDITQVNDQVHQKGVKHPHNSRSQLIISKHLLNLTHLKVVGRENFHPVD